MRRKHVVAGSAALRFLRGVVPRWRVRLRALTVFVTVLACAAAVVTAASGPARAASSDPTNPGGDFSVTIDDGGVPVSTMNQIVSTDLPASLGLPPNPPLSTLVTAWYEKTAVTGSTPPPTFTGGTISITTTTVTITVPATEVPSFNSPSGPTGALASFIAAVTALAAGFSVNGACQLYSAVRNHANVIASEQRLWCYGFAIAAGSATQDSLNAAWSGTPVGPDDWKKIATSAATNGLFGAVLQSYAAPWVEATTLEWAPGFADRWDAMITSAAAWIGTTWQAAVANYNNIIVQQPRLGNTLAQFLAAIGLATPVAAGAVQNTGLNGNFCMGTDPSPDDNAPATIEQCTPGTPSQTWKVWSNGSVSNDGLCLDITGARSTVMIPLEMYECNGGWNQQWRQNHYGTAPYIDNPPAGLCVDDPNWSTKSGTQLQTEVCNWVHFTTADQWVLPGNAAPTQTPVCEGQSGSGPSASDTLQEGQILTSGQELVSADGQHQVRVQADDGAVVVTGPGGTSWTAPGTAGHPGDCLILQTDGNLVAYAATGSALWAAGTNGSSRHAIIQTDGNFVVYDGSNAPRWASGTAGRAGHQSCGGQAGAGPSGANLGASAASSTGPAGILTAGDGAMAMAQDMVMVQPSDGGIVLSGPGGAIWSVPGTAGHPDDCLIMQTNGNLAAFTANGTLLWSSGTGGTSNLFATVQSDGNFVIYNNTNHAARWATGTFGQTGNTPVDQLPAPPTGGSLGSNVVVFNPGMSQATIQNDLNSLASASSPGSAQFTTTRTEVFFEPGTYGSASNPLVFSAGYYEAIAGLGKNPQDVTINGAIQSFDQCGVTLLGAPSGCYGVTNFWRSITNLTINVNGNSGCQAGTDFWATSQESPLRRVIVNGNFSLMDYCDAGPSWTSGGFFADSQFNGGKVTNGSQQQFFTRDTGIDNWSNSVWNQVFCGDPGAPAQQFVPGSGAPGGPSSYTTLATCPTTRESPYVYDTGGGNYSVFVPSVQHNSSGPTWAGGGTPGRSLPLSTFFVVNPGNVGQVNAALAAGDNLLFTPGVYDVTQTMVVTNPDTVIVGLGFPTLNSDGVTTMSTADVPGVVISGLIFDAGPSGATPLLQLGSQVSGADNSADPNLVSDVTFRVGGAQAGSTGTAFIDNSNNSVIDDVWAWRADHGAGGGSWTSDTADTGLVVNAAGVTAEGLAVEHFQKDEVDWNGNGGTVVFFQNENPYEVPNQASWMKTPTQNGYPAFNVGNYVTSFNGYGMGSYSYFDQGPDIHNSTAFQAPRTPGVSFHDLLTVWLNGYGAIDTVIDGTGTASNSGTKAKPQNVVSFP